MARAPRNYYPIKLGLLIAVISLLVLISLTALWLQRNIYDTERFTTITTKVFAKESSRQSIGHLVSSRVLEATPTLKSLLSERLAGHVANLLGTQQAQAVVERLARESQLLVTSPRQDPVVLQLSGIKSAIVSVQEMAGRTDATTHLDASRIPDEVMIIDTAQLPNIHQYAIIVLWLGPLSAVLVLILLAWWVRRSGKVAAVKRTQIALLVIGSSALVALAIGPLVEPLFISVGHDAPSQTLLHNLYAGFMAPFRTQALLLAGVALVLLVLLTVWHKVLRFYSVKVVVTKNNGRAKR